MVKYKGLGLLASGALLITALAGCSAESTTPCPETLQDDLALLSTTQTAEIVENFVEQSPVALPAPTCAFKVNHGGQIIGFWMGKDASFTDQVVGILQSSGFTSMNETNSYWTNGEEIVGVGFSDESGETALTGLNSLVKSAAIVMISP